MANVRDLDIQILLSSDSQCGTEGVESKLFITLNNVDLESK